MKRRQPARNRLFGNLTETERSIVMLPLPAPSVQTAPNLLDHALDYSRRGWSIIPVRGKVAAGLWKPFQERAAAESTLRRLFAKPDVTGIAVVTGTVSDGLAVRDFDDPVAYRRWASQHPSDAARLPTVQTSRG